MWIKSFVGWGFAPDLTGGAYSFSARPDPLAVFREGREEERESRRGGREFAFSPRKKNEKSAPMVSGQSDIYE